MRRILFWLSLTLIGAAGWVFSVVLSAITLGTHFKLAANFFGILMLGSMLLGVGIELSRYFLRKK